MNNQCPSCGAVYNVAAKDVGRRIRCKKCSAALVVAGAGLEVDDPAAADPAPAADDRREGRSLGSRLPGGFRPAEVLARVGGVSAVLFGFGIFLVVFTGFQEGIGKAKVERRQAAVDEGQAEMDAAEARFNEKKEKKPEDEKNFATLRENWEKRKKELADDKRAAEVANKRSGYVDRYYLMFGFLLIAFGCMGYLQAGSPLVMRIVAAVILVSMVLALFKSAAGSGAGIGVQAGIG